MKPSEIPFNVSFHFDSDLRDIPDEPREMARAVRLLLRNLETRGIDDRERLDILGLVGVYERLLNNLDTAERYLDQAVELSMRLNERRSLTANRIRLAHVYQWQRRYETADPIFLDVIASCEYDRELHGYLDFALQHYGKSLFDQERYDEAAAHFERALEIRLPLGNQELIESARVALETARRRIPRR